MPLKEKLAEINKYLKLVNDDADAEVNRDHHIPKRISNVEILDVSVAVKDKKDGNIYKMDQLANLAEPLFRDVT